MDETPEQFFDLLSKDYTAAIERCAPRYREMLWTIMHFLPSKFSPRRILELGCGTGNLSEVVAKTYPQAELHLVDISGKLLEECRERLGRENRFTYQQADFGSIDFSESSFDLITSSISIHHLDDGAKRSLFSRARLWLSPGGWLAYSDQFSAETSDAYEKHLAGWHREAISLGSTEEDWDLWMKHQDEHDHHATLCQQLQWLSEAGFSVIDCPWRYLFWTVLLARK